MESPSELTIEQPLVLKERFLISRLLAAPRSPNVIVFTSSVRLVAMLKDF